ncbi:ABC transporter ATP-binding protein [Paenibacillus elgii]|uniref:ABC transporter ATP-binding protein n=1 Tax=Paenibacillus elgii TaxID=189691 RepID=UPI000FD7E999|nr:ABC transporter ATP-binding protein [Paenibacillus elgii]NEN84306.1 ABC transporter ATP-binding protein [Paenibacillus elgii]
MSSDKIIEVTNVSKTYTLYDKPTDRIAELFFRTKKGKKVASLKNVSFHVNKGETVGIVGRNGAGKSTILQIIAGTLSPTTGSVKIKGRVVALLELGAGFNMEFSGEENVFLYGSILGLSKEEIKQRYQQILDFAEIGEFIRYPVKTYSSGMFVRLAFAVAINVSPEVLIIDEALSVGDVQFQHKCMAKLRELQSNGCTILFVSHDIDSVKSLCDSAILLNKGEVHSQGTADEIANNYIELIHQEQLDKRKQIQDNVGSLYEVTNKSLDWTAESFIGSERHGLGEAKIVKLLLEDANGRALDNIVYAEKLNVKFLVEYFMDISTEINVGLLFKDDKGIDILGDDSWNHKVLLPSAKQGSRFVLNFDFPNFYLKPGTYSITVALGAMSEDKATWNEYYYDWIDRAKILTIRTKEDVRVWSKVLLPAKITLD